MCLRSILGQWSEGADINGKGREQLCGTTMLVAIFTGERTQPAVRLPVIKSALRCRKYLLTLEKSLIHGFISPWNVSRKTLNHIVGKQVFDHKAC